IRPRGGARQPARRRRDRLARPESPDRMSGDTVTVELTTRRRPLPTKAKVGAAIVAVYVVAALVPSVLAPQDPLHQNLLARLKAPSADHWLGTDALGRDVYSRLVHATQIDLRVALLATGLSL